MPAFDPIFHYAGIGSLPDNPAAPVVVGCDSKSASQDVIEHALGRAMLLAEMDDGEAGPKMKSLFDAASAKDSAMPAGSADPDLNRHALADAFSFLTDKPQ